MMMVVVVVVVDDDGGGGGGGRFQWYLVLFRALYYTTICSAVLMCLIRIFVWKH